MIKLILTIFFPLTLLNLAGCGFFDGNSGSSTGNQVNVSGTVRYEDREYDLNGFTNRSSFFKPVRYATIELLDSATDEVLTTGTTDLNGNYSLSFNAINNQFHVRVLSEVSVSEKPRVVVYSLTKALYSVGGPDFSVTSTDVISDLTIASSLSAAGAFNILDVMTAAGEFVTFLEGASPSLLNIFWTEGTSRFGTYYCTAYDSTDCVLGKGIYVLGGSSFGGGDTDEYDDDVLWHEYGHFAADAFSRDDSPGGYHYLTDNDIDLRLAWSEGWSHFFMAAVKEWLTNNHPALLSTAEAVATSAYIDTYNSTSSHFNIAQPEASMVYASNEVAVANVLWETMTSASAGMSGLWDVFAEYIPFVSYPVNLEALWDGWLFLDLSDLPEKSLLDNIFSTRQIRYAADGYESDSSINPLRKTDAKSPAEFHTLYEGDSMIGDDRDFIAFDVISGQDYALRTSNLRNGSDTYMNLIDPDGYTVVASNDNLSGLTYTYPYNCSYLNGTCSVNDNITLSSFITFTAHTTSTFYAEVISSPYRPLSAGRYGSYMFSISNF